MRKMFSEKQIKGMIASGISERFPNAEKRYLCVFEALTLITSVSTLEFPVFSIISSTPFPDNITLEELVELFNGTNSLIGYDADNEAFKYGSIYKDSDNELIFEGSDFTYYLTSIDGLSVHCIDLKTLENAYYSI